MKRVGIYICPKCGFKPIAGEDIDTDKTRSLKKVKQAKEVVTTAVKQAWWSQILYYQRTRSAQGKPVSDGWCSHVYKKKFDVWPNGLHRTPMAITPVVSNFIKSTQIAYAKSKQGKAA